MSVKLKQKIETILGPVFLEKGFTYDLSRSRVSASGFVYSKGEPEPSDEWHKEYMDDIVKDIPKREEIIIGRSRWKPEISVLLRSFLKEPRVIDLGYLSGSNAEKWWPISTEEELRESFQEIIETMDKVGWNWFVLP